MKRFLFLIIVIFIGASCNRTAPVDNYPLRGVFVKDVKGNYYQLVPYAENNGCGIPYGAYTVEPMDTSQLKQF